MIRDYETEELICISCGMVVSSELVDRGPEWRAFDQEQRDARTRVGAPLSWAIHDVGLSTVIDWTGRDVYGRGLRPDQRVQAQRLRKWNRRSKISSSSERNLAIALTELNKVAYGLSLPKSVLETASVIYRRVVRERLIRGRSIEGVAAASIYMACRQCGVVRSLEEVGVAANLSKKEMGRNYRVLLRNLETRVPPAEAESYVSKVVNQLDLSGNVEILAIQILRRAAEMRLTCGRGPAGIAAAATYMASVLADERRTQGEIAVGIRVTEVTIRNRYKELIQKLSIEMDL